MIWQLRQTECQFSFACAGAKPSFVSRCTYCNHFICFVQQSEPLGKAVVARLLSFPQNLTAGSKATWNAVIHGGLNRGSIYLAIRASTARVLHLPNTLCPCSCISSKAGNMLCSRVTWYLWWGFSSGHDGVLSLRLWWSLWEANKSLSYFHHQEKHHAVKASFCSLISDKGLSVTLSVLINLPAERWKTGHSSTLCSLWLQWT